MESILADRIASLSWRLKRADRIQNQTIDAMDEETKHPPFPALARLRTRNREPQDPALTLGRLALKDFSNEKVLDRLLMYERRLENSLYKTTHELQNLQLLRQLNPQTEETPPTQPAFPKSPIPIMPKSPTPVSTRPSQNRSAIRYPLHATRCPTPTPAPIIHQPPTRPPKNHNLFTQNEPNPQNTKTNPTPLLSTSYNNKPPRPKGENEPNSNPIQRQSNPNNQSSIINNQSYPRPALPNNQLSIINNQSYPKSPALVTEFF